MIKQKALMAGMLLAGALGARGTAAEQGPSIKLINKSGHPIERVFFSATARENWGGNLITQPLADGASVQFTLAGTCENYDFRIVTARKVVFRDEGVGFCGTDNVLTINKASVKRGKTSPS